MRHIEIPSRPITNVLKRWSWLEPNGRTLRLHFSLEHGALGPFFLNLVTETPVLLQDVGVTATTVTSVVGILGVEGSVERKELLSCY